MVNNIIDNGVRDERLTDLIETLTKKGILTNEEKLAINKKGHGVKFKDVPN